MELNINELAQKYIKDFQNTKLKLNIPNRKFFLKVTEQEDIKAIEEAQNSLEIIIKHDRVNKRNVRNIAIWKAEKSLALVTKVAKSLLKSFGFQDKSGVYLYPEEMLFLLETNKLELRNNDIPISLSEAYILFQNCDKYNLNLYRAYKKLALLGYKILNPNEMSKRLEKIPPTPSVKRKIEEEETSQNNKKTNAGEPSKTAMESDSTSVTNDITTEYIDDVFRLLRQNGAREKNVRKITKEPDFYVFLPNNFDRTKYDFKLHVCENDILCNEDFFSNESNVVYAICTNDDVAFNKFSSLHLPCL